MRGGLSVMTGNNLYAWLKEFSLEKYCDNFHSQGINNCSDLVSLTMQDYPSFGITSMKDREKLFRLIQSVKAAEGNGISKGPPQKSAVLIKGDKNKENCRFTDEQDSTVKGKNDTVKRTKASINKSSLADKTAVPDKPAKSSKAVRGTVATDSGYNYGVPNSKPKLSVTKKSSIVPAEARIRVCVRKRPISVEEKQAGELDIVEVTGTDVVTVYAPKVAVDLSKYTQTYPFVFDEAFDESCTNEEVYTRTAKPLIKTVFNRGKATCFCYGCTGSGKTYTMLGNDKVQGLYILAAQDIFTTLHCNSQSEGLTLWVSFFEIYCGQLFDLLNCRAKLHAREDASHKVCINGLTDLEVQNVEELMELIDYGNTVRSTGSTGVNADSSRSHAVLQLEVKNDGGTKPVGRFSFIDLAGSERAADVTDTDRQTRMEGAEINQSLLALKECIRALDQDSKHTPFRQSKLTQVLKDSFVGNSHTCMIANISPNMSSSENTLNTLRYADRAKELRKTDTAMSPRPATVARSNFNFWSEEKNMNPKSNKNLPKLKIEEIRKEARSDLSKALERINMSDLDKLGNIRPNTTSELDCRETRSPGRLTRAHVLKVPKPRKGTSVTQSYNLSTPVHQLATAARPLTSPAVTPSKSNSRVKNLLKPQSRNTPVKRNNNYLLPSTNAARNKDVIEEEANTKPLKDGATGSSQFIFSKVSETEVKIPIAANNCSFSEQKLMQAKSTSTRDPNRLFLNKKRSNVLSKFSSSSSNLGDVLSANNTEGSPPLPNTRYSNKSFKARLSRLFNGKTSETRTLTEATGKESVDQSKTETDEVTHSIHEMSRMKTYPLLHREHGQLTLTQEQIIAAHHTQLALITGLCQEEMVLLRKVDSKDQRFTDYISQLDDILLQKAISIDTLRRKIASYSSK